MSHEQEIDAGKRFEFGENWSQFVGQIDEERLTSARRSLQTMLSVDSLHSRTFLDIGCGSGLFSLAARSLGATVKSFDYDPKSVACAQELKRRYYCNDQQWEIFEGSILDEAFVRSLGGFDVVYSWGVLHHTGEMWNAIARAASCVAPGGLLFIAIYNDQGWKSRLWRILKIMYNRTPRAFGLRKAFAAVSFLGTYGLFCLKYMLLLKFSVPANLFRRYRDKSLRGMSLYTDWVDWIGGYPFEVASAEAVKKFFENRGFSVKKLNRATSLGCHEFVLAKNA